MQHRSALLEALGGEAGCMQLSAEFYARVAKDPVLKPLFPGKSLRCATNEFAAFLVQFLGGDEEQTQYRWWLSLQESHARFKIAPESRSAWLKHMQAALEAAPITQETRAAFSQFFLHSSAHLTGKRPPPLPHQELATLWDQQRALDEAISAISTGDDTQALTLAPQFAPRRSVFVGLLARMLQSGRAPLTHYVTNIAATDPTISHHRFNGRTLLHYAAGAGSLEIVTLLLELGVNPNVQDHGRHTPLYRVANECAGPSGPKIVRALVAHGGDVNACAGVTRSTPLHMAARRGHVEIAQALIDAGAQTNARDSKGDTPLKRALNCRQIKVSQLLKIS